MVKFPGLWSLVSFKLFLSNGTLLDEPNGPHPLGRLVATTSGYISILITTPEAAVLPENVGWGNATDAQIAAIAKPMVTYCGTYNLIKLEDGQLAVTTVVDIALNPAHIGTVQKRNVTFVEEPGGKQFMELRPGGRYPGSLKNFF